MPGGPEAAVTNIVVRKGLTEKTKFEQGPENTWRKSTPGRGAVSPRVLSRILPGMCEEQQGSWYDQSRVSA